MRRHDIAYWIADDDYEGFNFVKRQVFFCGGDKEKFGEWKKARATSPKPKKAPNRPSKSRSTMTPSPDSTAIPSQPFPVKKGQKIAVLVIGQFGEETTKILELKYPSHRPEPKDLRKPRCNEID
jgi:adenine-specific DNA-methyltransferase